MKKEYGELLARSAVFLAEARKLLGRPLELDEMLLAMAGVAAGIGDVDIAVAVSQMLDRANPDRAAMAALHESTEAVFQSAFGEET